MDKDTNIWRASTFASILAKITSGDQASDSDTLSLSSAFLSNVDYVTQDLEQALQHLSGGTLDSNAPRDIVKDVGLLALRMAAQRAHILISACAHGQHVRPGQEFNCEGDVGFDAVVDLMTMPALKHVGDGHEDLTTTKVIEKGKFLALRR